MYSTVAAMLYIAAAQVPPEALNSLIAKQMLNIEHNRHLFDIHGVRLAPGTGRVFNSYDIGACPAARNVQIYSTYGTVLVYSASLDRKKIIKALEIILIEYPELRERTSYIAGNYIARAYKTDCRATRSDNYCDQWGSKWFTWRFKYVDDKCSYITDFISKTDKLVVLSATTIIVDTLQLLKYPHGHMQLDYPYFKDFRVHDRYVGSVHIGTGRFMSAEICGLLGGTVNRDAMHRMRVKLYWNSMIPNLIDHQLDHGEPLWYVRRDTGIELQQQLFEMVKEHRDAAVVSARYAGKYVVRAAELRDATDRCFTTGAPLFSYVDLAPYVCYFNGDGREGRFSFLALQHMDTCAPEPFEIYGYTIRLVCDSDVLANIRYPRSLDDVLAETPLRCDAAKSDMIRAAYRHGMYLNSTKVYIVSLETQKIYVGVETPHICDFYELNARTYLFRFTK